MALLLLLLLRAPAGQEVGWPYFGGETHAAWQEDNTYAFGQAMKQANDRAYIKA